MPKTITVKGYTFKELKKKAREKAIETFRNKEWWCWDQHDTDDLTECMAEKLKEKGFPHEDINWRLSSCQGDGVAFYGAMNVPLFFKTHGMAKELPLAERLSITLKKVNPHYDHWNSMGVEIEFNADEDDDELDTAAFEARRKGLEETVESAVVEMSRELEKMGYADIDYHNSDDYIKDGIEANDYLFHPDGRELRI